MEALCQAGALPLPCAAAAAAAAARLGHRRRCRGHRPPPPRLAGLSPPHRHHFSVCPWGGRGCGCHQGGGTVVVVYGDNAGRG